jgi:hypothetical protein
MYFIGNWAECTICLFMKDLLCIIIFTISWDMGIHKDNITSVNHRYAI